MYSKSAILVSTVYVWVLERKCCLIPPKFKHHVSLHVNYEWAHKKKVSRARAWKYTANLPFWLKPSTVGSFSGRVLEVLYDCNQIGPTPTLNLVFMAVISWPTKHIQKHVNCNSSKCPDFLYNFVWVPQTFLVRVYPISCRMVKLVSAADFSQFPECCWLTFQRSTSDYETPKKTFRVERFNIACCSLASTSTSQFWGHGFKSKLLPCYVDDVLLVSLEVYILPTKPISISSTTLNKWI